MASKRPHTQLYVHLVWATWDRAPLLTPEIERRVFAALHSNAEELGCRDILVNGMADHVHVLCRFPSALSLAEFVQQLKGASSHLVNHALRPAEEFRWQGGYGAFTVYRASLERVRRYVLNQKEHHRGESWLEWEQTESAG